MDGLAAFALGPLLYLAVGSAGWVALRPLPESLGGKVASAAAGSALAILSLARGARAPLGREVATALGLVALVVAVAIGSPLSGPPTLCFVHAALLLAAAGGLGQAFASVIRPRLPEPSVLVTTAVCLALFDGWSVLFGPAGSAAEGGFLQRLLLDAPAPGGTMHIIGISDLVLIALLAELSRLAEWSVARTLLAGLAGLELALAQAVMTRHSAPALPWIGVAFCAVTWKHVRPDRAGWVRTGRWAARTGVALVVLTGALRLFHGA